MGKIIRVLKVSENYSNERKEREKFVYKLFT